MSGSQKKGKRLIILLSVLAVLGIAFAIAYPKLHKAPEPSMTYSVFWMLCAAMS